MLLVQLNLWSDLSKLSNTFEAVWLPLKRSYESTNGTSSNLDKYVTGIA